MTMLIQLITVSCQVARLIAHVQSYVQRKGIVWQVRSVPAMHADLRKLMLCPKQFWLPVIHHVINECYVGLALIVPQAWLQAR